MTLTTLDEASRSGGPLRQGERMVEAAGIEPAPESPASSWRDRTWPMALGCSAAQVTATRSALAQLLAVLALAFAAGVAAGGGV